MVFGNLFRRAGAQQRAADEAQKGPVAHATPGEKPLKPDAKATTAAEATEYDDDIVPARRQGSQVALNRLLGQAPHGLNAYLQSPATPAADPAALSSGLYGTTQHYASSLSANGLEPSPVVRGAAGSRARAVLCDGRRSKPLWDARPQARLAGESDASP
jgi:hypothetical protein